MICDERAAAAGRRDAGARYLSVSDISAGYQCAIRYRGRLPPRLTMRSKDRLEEFRRVSSIVLALVLPSDK